MIEFEIKFVRSSVNFVFFVFFLIVNMCVHFLICLKQSVLCKEHNRVLVYLIEQSMTIKKRQTIEK